MSDYSFNLSTYRTANNTFYDGAGGDTFTVTIRPGFGTDADGSTFGVDAGDIITVTVDPALTASITYTAVPQTLDYEPTLIVYDAGVEVGRIVIAGANDADVTFNFVCFTRGARVATPDGPRAIEDLAAGDLVLTRDRGAQPLRWVGATKLTAETLAAFPEKRPVTIAAGTFGDHAETTVSPAHRVLVTGWKAEALFGQPEMLATAGSLVDDAAIRRAEASEPGGVEYFHLMFDAHELVCVDGLWSESFHPAAMSTGLDAATRDEVLELFPHLEATLSLPVARPALTAADVVVFG